MGEPRDLDVERFIEAVRARPPLWDTACDGYMDKARKTSLWHELAALFTPSWPALEASERQPRVNALQKRWKNLRDRFRKELQIQTSQEKLGTDAKKKRKYIYYDQLKFLKQAIDFRETRKNMEAPWDLTERRVKKEERTPSPVWQAEEAWPMAEDDEDGDVLFLKSLARDLRKLDPVTKLMVKKGMLDTVSSAVKASTMSGPRFPPPIPPHHYYPLLHQFLHQWHYFSQQQPDSKLFALAADATKPA